jgi:hypothetical protein
MDQVCELGRKLLYDSGPSTLTTAGPPWEDHPAAFLRGLEETAEGCRWLLDRWIELRDLVDCRAVFTMADGYKFIRLQGKCPIEAINDLKLNLIFLAWDTLCPGFAETFWTACKESTPRCERGFGEATRWRELIRRPSDKEAAWALLLSVADRQVRRLEELVGVHEEIAAEEAAELADRASFDPSASFERLRRFQSAKSRELRQTLDALAKMRKTPRARKLESGMGNGEFPSEDSRFQNEQSQGQVAEGEGPRPVEESANGGAGSPAGNGKKHCEPGGERKARGSCATEKPLTTILIQRLAEIGLETVRAKYVENCSLRCKTQEKPVALGGNTFRSRVGILER